MESRPTILSERELILVKQLIRDGSDFPSFKKQYSHLPHKLCDFTNAIKKRNQEKLLFIRNIKSVKFLYTLKNISIKTVRCKSVKFLYTSCNTLILIAI